MATGRWDERCEFPYSLLSDCVAWSDGGPRVCWQAGLLTKFARVLVSTRPGWLSSPAEVYEPDTPAEPDNHAEDLERNERRVVRLQPRALPPHHRGQGQPRGRQ